MNFAPIILFTYNRPKHTLEVLNALSKNDEAKESILFIYCDGIKKNSTQETINDINEVRKICQCESRFKQVDVIFQEKNLGLANSIISGVTEIVNKYGKIIVLEDDIVTSSGFLNYMNTALDFYQNNNKVMHISGYMYPHNENLPETFFYNVPLCWGWATWARSWKFFSAETENHYHYFNDNDTWDEFNKLGKNRLKNQLDRNFTGDLETWFIKWHSSVLINKGYCLFPSKSFVNNVGFDNSGENCTASSDFNHTILVNNIKINAIELEENKEAEIIIKGFYDKVELNEIKSQKKSFITKIKISTKKKLAFIVKIILIKLIPNLNNLSNLNNSHTKDACIGLKSIQNEPYVILESIIGNYTYIAANSFLSKVSVGKYCSIGPNFFAGYGIHPIHNLSTSPMFYSTLKQNGITLSKVDKIVERKPIKIGNDVFIGMNVTILDGVTIGDGAVIGAGAVVSKNIPPYAVAIGCPIKILKYRFDEKTIENLLSIKWWNWDVEKLNDVESNFETVKEFVKKYRINQFV